MFKKQNSLLKKRFNYLHNLHPIFYKKNLKKKINVTNIKDKKLKLLKNLYTIKFLLKKNSTYSSINTLNGKKKLKKVILNNRSLYNFLNYNSFKTSKNLSTYISKKSKLKNLSNLLNLEYSSFNIILNSNLVKSYTDLVILLQSKSIFLNRMPLKKLNKELNVGDIIEFYLSKKMYNYIIYFKELISRNIIKTRNKLWYKLRLKDKNKLDYNKNNLINNVFKNNFLFKSYIPNYIEIDYYTLSIIIVIKSFNFNSYTLNIKKILVLYLFKLYNWK